MIFNNTLKSTLTLLLLSSLFVFSSCKKDEPDKLVTISKDDYTDSEKNTISEKISEAFLSQPDEFPVLEEQNYAAAYGYLRQCLRSMVNTPLVEKRNTLNWDIKILNDDNSYRSFGLPNGELYMTTGLFKLIQNESQLIALMGHEIYYLDNNLIMDELVNEFGGRVFGDLLLDNHVEQVEEIAMRTKTLTFNKETVSQADDFAMENICPFEYEAAEFSKLITHLTEVNAEIEWLQMRPGMENRLQLLQTASIDCDDEEPIEESRYQMFKDNLLP